MSVKVDYVDTVSTYSLTTRTRDFRTLNSNIFVKTKKFAKNGLDCLYGPRQSLLSKKRGRKSLDTVPLNVYLPAERFNTLASFNQAKISQLLAAIYFARILLTANCLFRKTRRLRPKQSIIYTMFVFVWNELLRFCLSSTARDFFLNTTVII